MSKINRIVRESIDDYIESKRKHYSLDEAISRIIKKNISRFINEDGATAAGGGATSSFNVGVDAGNNGAGNGFEYDVPIGTSKKNKGGDVMRRTFWTAGNNEKTMQSVDDEGSDVVNKKKRR